MVEVNEWSKWEEAKPGEGKKVKQMAPVEVIKYADTVASSWIDLSRL